MYKHNYKPPQHGLYFYNGLPFFHSLHSTLLYTEYFEETLKFHKAESDHRYVNDAGVLYIQSGTLIFGH